MGQLFPVFADIVARGEGFPQQPPLTRSVFDDVWVRPVTLVAGAMRAGTLLGAYYLKPNLPGLGSHIANAGYVVDRRHRGTGLVACLSRTRSPGHPSQASTPSSSTLFSRTTRLGPCTKILVGRLSERCQMASLRGATQLSTGALSRRYVLACSLGDSRHDQLPGSKPSEVAGR